MSKNAAATSAGGAANTTSSINPSPLIKKYWPKEAQDLYDPVRVLGTGGFASVILAKEKKKKESSDSNNEDKKNASPASSLLVAMKLVGPTANTMSSESWRLYAYRELDILRELSHPNIIKVIHAWETSSSSSASGADNNNKDGSSSNSPILMALQYVKGPTVQDLLLYRGALNPNGFGRVVIAQLVDALSYLHSHAVIHRDIKPDNIIVTGALSSQDCIWQEEEEEVHDNNDNGRSGGGGSNEEENNGGGGGNTEKTTNSTSSSTNDDCCAAPAAAAAGEPNWEVLRKKWHVTLIDFGFARALTPDDVAKPSLTLQKENLNASYSIRHLNINNKKKNPDGEQQQGNKDEDGSSSKNNNNSSRNTTSSSGGTRNNNNNKTPPKRSLSRRIHKQMSALGNRQYAAPEILKVQRLSSSSGTSTTTTTTTRSSSASISTTATTESSTTTKTTRTSKRLTETFSEFVSEYGLLVDAYSLGHTIRYMLTGVPPNESVAEKIAYKKSFLYKLGQQFKKLISSSSSRSAPTKPKKIYRLESDLPGEVQQLIENLTERLESKRMSVRAARRYSWIDNVLVQQEQGGTSSNRRKTSTITSSTSSSTAAAAAALSGMIIKEEEGQQSCCCGDDDEDKIEELDEFLFLPMALTEQEA